MIHKDFIKNMGFIPKENALGVYHKRYSLCDDYAICIDFEKEVFDYGARIEVGHKSAQNFSNEENWVVLECVDRLLEKGYQAHNIILEKTWATGHGTSGRLDILVTRENGSPYLMIECKTWDKFERGFKKMHKDGGQLFTYFQQDKEAEVLMLYASTLEDGKVLYRNEIVKIEADYRDTGNVKDLFERWNKLPKSNGIFENWVKAYQLHSKALTRGDLKVLKHRDSSFIFNRFLEILRHNVVSDKPNAFNKMFTLFLCKVVDESRNDDEQLHFQWIEGEDTHISFQKRLTDLYNRGMNELLEKKVTDISDKDMEKRFRQVDGETMNQFKEILTEIRLKKNNEFAIKEVYDDDSFEDNAKVVKEVVELLQGFKIRYNYRQRFLSDFFEMLLTTGLKQESGQFFTPVPIARFIIKSLPIREITEQKLQAGIRNDLLPTIIDYAAGSGHFITEVLEDIQKYIDSLDGSKYSPHIKRSLKKWSNDQFDWSDDYVYGIEKDYRLVKTAKVSCYLHGDGLAKVIHGDGLADFATAKEYKGLLKETDSRYPQDNKQFDVIISNPPFSVEAFKGTLMTESKAKKAFDLYDRLTDQSSEIECLFVERTKQLMKDGGVAGIILPSSILSNGRIYTAAREVILQYFEVLGLAKFGSKTFMATGTNTVALFLRRRSNEDSEGFKKAVKRFFTDFQDRTINGIEYPVKKYMDYVWEGVSLEDYISLLKKRPNETIREHDNYKDYDNELKEKGKQKMQRILEIEQEKLLYFVLVYSQKIVFVQTGEKEAEKKFLGYYFSNRRGSEGIHPMRRGKNIDECTSLYDENDLVNSSKASTYIHAAFNGQWDLEIPSTLQKNVVYQNLVDMMDFKKVDFDKGISFIPKKKLRIESKWEKAKLGAIAKILNGGTPDTKIEEYWNGGINWATLVDTKNKYLYSTASTISKKGVAKSSATILPVNTVIFSSRATIGDVCINKVETSTNQGYKNFVCKPDMLNNEYLYYILTRYSENIAALGVGMTYAEISKTAISNFKIPLPPISIQEKMVKEMIFLENEENQIQKQIVELTSQIFDLLNKEKWSKNLLKKSLTAINPSKRKTVDKTNVNTLVSFLSMADISNEGEIINLQERELMEVKTGFCFFQENDVLFAKITPCMENGKGALIGKLKNGIGFGSTEFFVLRANPKKLSPKILYYITRTTDFRENAAKAMTGASGHKRVPKSFVENYLIPDIPIDEQVVIVKEIESLERKIAVLEDSIKAIPQKKEAVLEKYLK